MGSQLLVSVLLELVVDFLHHISPGALYPLARILWETGGASSISCVEFVADLSVTKLMRGSLVLATLNDAGVSQIGPGCA